MKNDLIPRTRQFALSVIRMVEQLPRSPTTLVIGKQLIRCGTSVGANYRAACRAKSARDFVAKMGIVEEEADECVYWLELLQESGLASDECIRAIKNEAQQLTAITVASIRTARQKMERKA